MFCVFDPRQLRHSPARELHNGQLVAHSETPSRADAISAAIGPTDPPEDHGIEPLLAVHCPDYVRFLRSAHEQWLEAGREGDAFGYSWPLVRRRPVDLDRIDAKLGQFSYDASTPIGPGSWESAYWSAQTALTALQPLIAGELSSAFALCRPPGHHCGRDYLGGYCYLNNAAIAAEAAAGYGARVAILDIDYHHGNGTQDIFWERGDIAFVSIHADPATDYPFFWGRKDERGEGKGEGKTLNLPLPRGTAAPAYLETLETALDAVRGHGAEILILSFGADTFEGDPISHFRLRTADYPAIASRIAALGLPTLIAMEGGYAVEHLGANVAAFLNGFETGGC